MNFYELARQMVVSVIALALNATSAIVERMLPHRPDWLERIDVLAAQYRSVAADAAQSRPKTKVAGNKTAADDVETEEHDAASLLGAYNALWQFTQQIKEQGLSLDDDFCNRIEREWSTSTLIGFLQAAEVSLRENAERAQTAANEFLAQNRQP